MKKAFIVTYDSIIEKDIISEKTTKQKFFNGEEIGLATIKTEYFSKMKTCQILILAKDEAEANYKAIANKVKIGISEIRSIEEIKKLK